MMKSDEVILITTSTGYAVESASTNYEDNFWTDWQSKITDRALLGRMGYKTTIEIIEQNNHL